MSLKTEIRLAPNSGFCFGVKRAIKLAREAAETNKKIVTLGPIIHNPQLVERLRQRGVDSVDNLDAITDQTVIIRSHGVEHNVLEKLKNSGAEIIDATCPYVAKAQELAKKLSREGYPVCIMGNASHPEVKAIRSYIEGEVFIIENENELPEKNFTRLGLISQTTKSLEDFQNVASKLLPKAKELRIVNTICSATSVRQQATMSLALESDIMIVIGGYNSSNTKMLAKICQNIIETQHIETAVELQGNWFTGKFKIGLTAGASTPDWIIVNVYNEINKYTGNGCPFVSSIEEIPGYKE
ncbi:MAG: 4-hydroxy-3-methylbut-2-enyl diphosphate reductase [Candidatus Cloacimonetes bacterium]|nr:4-hydroxy-3-methylbut-2-enyl diphosphate reductase [Candidatus Cloacimonadota bacterium]